MSKVKGKVFEKEVIQYLRKRGYAIIGQNIKIAQVEIDILAQKFLHEENHYFFVECKSHWSWGYPYLREAQKRRYFKAMRAFQANLGQFANVHFSLALPDSLTKEVVFFPDYSTEIPI